MSGSGQGTFSRACRLVASLAGCACILIFCIALAQGAVIGQSNLTGQARGSTAAPTVTKTTDKYTRFSDAPGSPRTVRSAHFILHTDVSDRNTYVLLDKLEMMWGLIVQYYGRSHRQPIECFVVRDLAQWPEGAIPTEAVSKIAEGAGITMQAGRTIAYSCADHGVAQHEAVHALCFLTFGSTGPTWYSEGMAEMGQYWKKDERHVNINPAVVQHLTSSAAPKQLLAVVNPLEPPGTWQDYAWRWALCHLLANNPNYSPHFRGLGIALMEGKNTSFEAVYGQMAKEILFEYHFFIQHLANGLRADLIAWDWKTRGLPLPIEGERTATIHAARGWQPSRVAVSAGQKYRSTSDGAWKIHPEGEMLDAGGGAAKQGQLSAAVFNNYQLSEPFSLGTESTFTAPGDGYLYLRCADAWHELSDNEGTINVTLRRIK